MRAMDSGSRATWCFFICSIMATLSSTIKNAPYDVMSFDLRNDIYFHDRSLPQTESFLLPTPAMPGETVKSTNIYLY